MVTVLLIVAIRPSGPVLDFYKFFSSDGKPFPAFHDADIFSPLYHLHRLTFRGVQVILFHVAKVVGKDAVSFGLLHVYFTASTISPSGIGEAINVFESLKRDVYLLAI